MLDHHPLLRAMERARIFEWALLCARAAILLEAILGHGNAWWMHNEVLQLVKNLWSNECMCFCFERSRGEKLRLKSSPHSPTATHAESLCVYFRPRQSTYGYCRKTRGNTLPSLEKFNVTKMCASVETRDHRDGAENIRKGADWVG